MRSKRHRRGLALRISHPRVDLNTRGSLSKYFVDEVLAEARTVHVAA